MRTVKGERWFVAEGDCLAVLSRLPADRFDAFASDPPYELGFMGKKWDASGIAYSPELWRSVIRVLKPGAHGLAFGGTRTYHRMTCAIEDAGLEIRDSLHWFYGTGFPKSLNVGEGRGTALKPAHEPIVLFRKPLEGTVAANVSKWGTGALNIDACRIEGAPWKAHRATGLAMGPGSPFFARGDTPEIEKNPHALGRWPANVLLDEDAADELDAQSGVSGEKPRVVKRNGDRASSGWGLSSESHGVVHGDSGGASRFFYVSKPGGKERDLGCDDLPPLSGGEATDRVDGSIGVDNPRAGAGRGGGRRNYHPTVKPIDLMRYLVRLVTPPGGTILDPFVGSGTTGIAALREGRSFVGIEREPEYVDIAERRIRAA